MRREMAKNAAMLASAMPIARGIKVIGRRRRHPASHDDAVSPRLVIVVGAIVLGFTACCCRPFPAVPIIAGRLTLSKATISFQAGACPGVTASSCRDNDPLA